MAHFAQKCTKGDSIQTLLKSHTPHLLAFPGQLGGCPHHKRKLSWLSRTWTCVGNYTIVLPLKVFFIASCNFQNNFLHNFTRHWCETYRPVISRVFSLQPFLKLGQDFPASSWLESQGILKLLRNDAEKSQNNLSQPFHYSGMM